MFRPAAAFGALCAVATVAALGQANTPRPDVVAGAEPVNVERVKIYPGTHTSAVAFRFRDFVIPFFAKNLSFERPKR